MMIEMKFLTAKETATYGIPAIFGGLATYAFGGWTATLELLIWMQAIDLGSGILASLKEGKGLRSSTSFWGLIKKALMWGSILMGYKLEVALGASGIVGGCVYFWITNEIISLTENYGRLGLPLPEVIKSKIEIIKGKSSIGGKM